MRSYLLFNRYFCNCNKSAKLYNIIMEEFDYEQKSLFFY